MLFFVKKAERMLCDLSQEYQELNLYTNYEEAARMFPHTKMIFDEELPAFPEIGRETTYQLSLELIKKRAFQLAACGIKKGDHIILFKSPKFDTYLLAVATAYLGAIPVMISYHFPASTIDAFIERLEQPYLLFDEETQSVAQTLSDCPEARKINLKKLLELPNKEVPQAELAPDAICYITHTSGTTGIPKLICHSSQSMGWRTLWQRKVFTHLIPEKRVAFHISPVHSRFNIGVSSLMKMGFPMVVLNNGQEENVAEMLKKYQPQALETHPNHFVQWAFLAKKSPEVFASIRYYHSTFDAINNGTMRAFLEASAKNDPIFLQVYGQSECGPMILKKRTLATIEQDNARNMGIGLEDLTKARVADENGQPLPINTPGNIHFLSKGRALTYYKEDARFQQTTFGDWWDTGDYGVMDEYGQLFLMDRQVDLIEKIDSTLALEDFLLDQLDFLAEVVIVRDQQNEPQPILALAPNCTMNWEAWWEKISDLPRLNEPILKDFADIPRTATMKVQRLAIQEALRQGTF